MFNYFYKFIKFATDLAAISILMFFIVPAQAQVSSDVIAIRVIPNQEHYSALRWYKKQGFSGSPQSLIVDGYEAVRDGRTVYANVGNIANSSLYANIYLISYNQEAGGGNTGYFFPDFISLGI